MSFDVDNEYNKFKDDTNPKIEHEMSIIKKKGKGFVKKGLGDAEKGISNVVNNVVNVEDKAESYIDNKLAKYLPSEKTMNTYEKAAYHLAEQDILKNLPTGLTKTIQKLDELKGFCNAYKAYKNMGVWKEKIQILDHWSGFISHNIKP